jgi:PAS domain S-box-containing protein
MADILRITAGLDPGSAVRRLLREHDWSSSPLGRPGTWPAELRTAVTMAVSSSFPMFVAWGPELTFLYNDAYVPVLGDKHPAAFGARMAAVWHEIWPDLSPIVERALANESAWFEDMPLLMERKGYREQTYFTFSYSPLHDADGRVQGLYCTCIETTARVQSERRAAVELTVADALRPTASSEDVILTASALLGEELGLARVLYGEVDDARGLFHIPRDWHRSSLPSLAGNTFTMDMFGPAVSEAGRLGETVAIVDTARDPRTSAVRAAYDALGVTACLLVPLVRDGRLLAFLGLGQDRAHRWTDAEIALARGVAGRVSTAVDLARTQATLREERDRSQTIFNTIAEGFMLLDRDWHVLQINAEGQRLLGVDRDDVVGRSHWEIWPEARNTDGARMYHQAMHDRVKGQAEYYHQHPDGSELWLELRAYPAEDGGLVVFFRDITKRRRAEQKLRDADQRKDEFLAMLAHELRNPLAPISAAADLLRIGRLDEARVRQSSAIIGRQVRHMTSLVDDLLDVSRVTRGLVTLARGPVTARAIVDEAIEQVRPMFDARRQRLEVALAEPDATVLGDKARLVQVLANLLGNASKYSPEGRRIAVSATVDADGGADGDKAGEHLLLSVHDEGIGMERELTRHAFDLFTQAKRSSDRSQGGLGLGLALVKHLVELHGGTVACASPGLGKGSTFEVTLPLMRTAPLAADAQAGEAAPTAGARPLRVLVVDDNVDAAATLGMLLEACGHAVKVENGSFAALESAHAWRPDVALLDIGLPDMDGNELARRLRAAPDTRGIVLVAVTGYGQEQDRRAALEAGFDHHLVKPVDMDRLAGLLAGMTAAGAPVKA